MAVGAEGNVYQGAIARGAWVDAEHLQAGFLLLNHDESWAEVERVEVLPVELKAFNLSVADNHTYFVAANDEAPAVWVHNTCKVWNEDTLKILADLLADPKIADRIAKNPKLLDGWKRVTEDFADSGGGNFGQYWESAVARGNVKLDDMRDFASARNWKHPGNPDWDLYPPNQGFDYDDALKKFDRGPVTLSGGKKLDRYINNGVDPFDDTGEFLADQGVSLTSRALPPGATDTKQLIQYRVAEGRQIDFESGKITPWFDEVGGSTQYYTRVPVSELIKRGDLIVIIPRPTPKQILSGNLFSETVEELPAGYKFVTNNGRRYIRRTNAANPDTPRVMIGEDGYIKPYTGPDRLSSSAKFNSNLEAKLGPMPPGHQRHHIVPDNIVKNSALHKEAIERGLYDIDRADNGIYLAGDAEAFTDISKAYPTHNGSHPEYDLAVNAILDKAVAGKDLKAMTDDEIEGIVDKVEDAALDLIENWTNNRLN